MHDDEKQILDLMVKLRGKKFVDEFKDLILDQARELGELDPVPDTQNYERNPV